MSKQLATAAGRIPWLLGLNEANTVSIWTHDAETLLCTEDPDDETVESDDPDPDAVPLFFEEYERQCHDELIRIHGEALEQPVTDQAHARAKAIVAKWKQKKSEHELTNAKT